MYPTLILQEEDVQLQDTPMDAVKEVALFVLQGLLAWSHAFVIKVVMQEMTVALTFVL